jgi:hypothetical protein
VFVLRAKAPRLSKAAVRAIIFFIINSYFSVGSILTGACFVERNLVRKCILRFKNDCLDNDFVNLSFHCLFSNLGMIFLDMGEFSLET